VVDEDVLTYPDLVAEKYPLLSAAWFWDNNKLNTLADKGSTDTDITAITKRVNGGTHGLEDRISKFRRYYTILG
jgi:putative chitinase